MASVFGPDFIDYRFTNGILELKMKDDPENFVPEAFIPAQYKHLINDYFQNIALNVSSAQRSEAEVQTDDPAQLDIHNIFMIPQDQRELLKIPVKINEIDSEYGTTNVFFHGQNQQEDVMTEDFVRRFPVMICEHYLNSTD